MKKGFQIFLVLDKSTVNKLEWFKKRLETNNIDKETFAVAIEKAISELEIPQLNSKPYLSDLIRDHIRNVRKPKKAAKLPLMKMFSLSQLPDRSSKRKRYSIKEIQHRLILIKLQFIKEKQKETLKKLIAQGRPRIVRLMKTGRVRLLGVK